MVVAACRAVQCKRDRIADIFAASIAICSRISVQKDGERGPIASQVMILIVAFVAGFWFDEELEVGRVVLGIKGVSRGKLVLNLLVEMYIGYYCVY